MFYGARHVKRWLVLLPWRLLLVVAGMLLLLRYTVGGGERLEDRTGEPVLKGTALEVVANLPLPPGNVAVSQSGRVFFTFHPEADPPVRVAELVGGKPVPYPDEEFQKRDKGTAHFQTPLAVRVDRQDRLWVLDYGGYGITGQPRIFSRSRTWRLPGPQSQEFRPISSTTYKNQPGSQCYPLGCVPFCSAASGTAFA